MKNSFLLFFVLINVGFSQNKDFLLGDNPEKKIAYYDSIIRIRPFAGEYMNRGYINFLAKKYDDAMSDYDKAISLDKNNFDYFFRRAELKRTLKDYRGAIIDYSKVIDLNNKNFTSYYYRGLIKKELADVTGSFSDFSKAIEIDPKNTLSYLKRGSINMEMNKFHEAIKDFNKALELDSVLLEALQNRAISKASIGDRSAINDFNKLVTLDPCAESYLNRALFYINNNIKTDFCIDLRKSVSMGSKDAKIYLSKYCK
jgi:tetratricopeptide (TPR) repeat protein